MHPSSSSASGGALDLTDKVILRELVHVIDRFGLPEFRAVAANYGQQRYGYAS